MVEMPDMPAPETNEPVPVVRYQDEVAVEQQKVRDQLFMSQVGIAMDLDPKYQVDWQALSAFYARIPDRATVDEAELEEWNTDLEELVQLKLQTRQVLTVLTEASRSPTKTFEFDNGRVVSLEEAQNTAKRVLVRFLLKQNHMLRTYTNEEPYELPEFLVAPLSPQQDVLVNGTRALLKTQYDLAKQHDFTDIEPKDLVDEYNLVLRALLERNYRIGRMPAPDSAELGAFLQSLNLDTSDRLVQGYTMVHSLLGKHKATLDHAAEKQSITYEDLRIDDALLYITDTPDLVPVASELGGPLLEVATTGRVSSLDQVYSKLNESLSVEKMKRLIIEKVQSEPRFSEYDPALLAEKTEALLVLFTTQHKDIQVKDEMARLSSYSALDQSIAEYLLQQFASQDYLDAFAGIISIAQDSTVQAEAVTDIQGQLALESDTIDVSASTVDVSDAVRLFYLNSLREQSGNKSGNIFMLLKTIEVLKKGSKEDRFNALTLELRLIEFLERMAERGLINGVSSLAGDYPDLSPEVQTEINNMNSYLASEFSDRLQEAAHIVQQSSPGTKFRFLLLWGVPVLITSAGVAVLIGLKNMAYNRLAKFKRTLNNKTPAEIKAALGLDATVPDAEVLRLRDSISQTLTDHEQAKGMLNAPTRLRLLVHGYQSKSELRSLAPAETDTDNQSQLDAYAESTDSVGAGEAANTEAEANANRNSDANPGANGKKFRRK